MKTGILICDECKYFKVLLTALLDYSCCTADCPHRAISYVLQQVVRPHWCPLVDSEPKLSPVTVDELEPAKQLFELYVHERLNITSPIWGRLIGDLFGLFGDEAKARRVIRVVPTENGVWSCTINIQGKDGGRECQYSYSSDAEMIIKFINAHQGNSIRIWELQLFLEGA